MPDGTTPDGATPGDGAPPGHAMAGPATIRRPAATGTNAGRTTAEDTTAGGTTGGRAVARSVVGGPAAGCAEGDGAGRAEAGAAPAEAPAPWDGARGLLYLGVLSGAVALCALAAALYFGGALTSSVPWLDGSGGLTRGGLPVSELVMTAAGTVTVGLLLAGAVLLAGPDGGLPPLARRCLRSVRVSAGIWVAATLVTTVLSVSYLLGKPVSQVTDADLLSYLTDLTRGRALVVIVVLAGVPAVCASRPRSAGGAGGLLLVALAGLLPQVVTGHSASSDDHWLAVFSLAVHVTAAAVWVGGLLVLTALARPAGPLLAVIVPRYSALAGVCFAAVAASGLVNAWLQLGGAGAVLGSRYGLLVLAKVAALGCLGLLGWRHRRASLPALRTRGRGRVFVRLAAAEVVVMAAAMALATALSRTPPPAEDTGPTDPAGVLLGFEAPGPAGVAAYAFGRLLDPLFCTLVAAGAGLYLAGVLRLRRAGVRWPVRRTLAWYGGLLIVLVATCGGLARYSMVLFSNHVVQHLVLTLVAPVPLLLAAPADLALRSLHPGSGSEAVGRTPRDLLVSVLESRAARLSAHPVAALTAAVLVLYGFYASPLFEASLRNYPLHSLAMVVFLATGMLFMRAVHGGARWLPLALAPFHLVFGYAFMTAASVIAGDWYEALARTWGPLPEQDQRTAGLLIWVIGGLATVTLPFLARRAPLPQGSGMRTFTAQRTDVDGEVRRRR
ncbi:putative copper resistance protein D [Thermomonospora echinospora]|uniref:Putative copper resistance protein D n=2 Tax=Thermomonospora echinospora TaxID=1992 RepID=A0A1H5VLK0_9ACTN|nr:putative copper resistance protein D [Thermomonospora echinospora]